MRLAIIAVVLFAASLIAPVAGSVELRVAAPVRSGVSLLLEVNATIARGAGVVVVRYSGINVSCPRPGVPGAVLEAAVKGYRVVSIPAKTVPPILLLLAETGLLAHGGWRVTTPYPLVNATCRQGLVVAVYRVPMDVNGSLHAELVIDHGVLHYTYHGPPTGYEEDMVYTARSLCGNSTLKGSLQGEEGGRLPRLLASLMPASPLQALMYLEAYAAKATCRKTAETKTTPSLDVLRTMQELERILAGGAGEAAKTPRAASQTATATGTAKHGGGGLGGLAPYILLPAAGLAALAVMLRRRP